MSGWNYTNTNGPIDEIPDNSRSELFYHIADVLDAVNEHYNIACTRVDLVVHSMGGLMARRFLQADSGQKNSALAYKQGLIRRIITIATPHEGSPMANYALYGDTPLAPDTVADLLDPDYLFVRGVLALVKGSVQSHFTYAQSGLRDLAVNSELINSLNSRSSVPIHVIYGRVRENIDSLQFFDLPRIFFVILRYMPSLFSTPSALFRIIFGDDDYDIAVGMSSAVSKFSSSTEKSGLDYNHVSICKQDDIGGLVVQLLQGPSSKFDTSGVGVSARFSSPRTSKNVSVINPVETANIFTQEFNLTVNGQDSTLTANQLQTVNFTAKIDTEMNNGVYLFMDGDSDARIITLNDEGDKKTFSANFVIPNNLTGVYELSCAASGDYGKIYTSNTVELVIKPNLTNIQSLEFINGSKILLNTSSDFILPLFATTRDGGMYNVASPLMGTEISIDNNSIARITEDGHIIGLRQGTAAIRASLGDYIALVSVDVGAVPTPQENITPTPTPVPTPTPSPDIVPETSPDSEPYYPDYPVYGGGGGGCNSGMIIISLVFVGILAINRKKF
ncbi:MAG: alpha/beta hydrolase [Synergistaceae bacterium]|nr:alpha/beta hydrolase [Synergistaceae bacterium]